MAEGSFYVPSGAAGGVAASLVRRLVGGCPYVRLGRKLRGLVLCSLVEIHYFYYILSLE